MCFFTFCSISFKFSSKNEGSTLDQSSLDILMKELSEKFRNHNLLLTASIKATTESLQNLAIFREISQYFSHIAFELIEKYNVSAKYDLTDDILKEQNSVQNLKQAINGLNIELTKIVLGVHFRAVEFKNFNSGLERVGTYLGYNRVCAIQFRDKSKTFPFSWTNNYVEKINFGVTIQGNSTVIVFDSKKTVEHKTGFAMENNLAGVMALYIDSDDFLGNCAKAVSNVEWEDFPLLRSIDATLRQRVARSKTEL